jgi:hypothetical protein
VVAVWAGERFGATAPYIEVAAARAIHGAHTSSSAAQTASGTKKQDPYGHTMKRRQFEQLVEQTADLPGRELVHPKGAAYDLVHFPDAQAVLFPWRFARDGATQITNTRITMSKILSDLLVAPGNPGGQLTTDDAELSAAELDARFNEEQKVAQDLRAWGAVVIIGFASSSLQLHKVGWGEGFIPDDTSGEITWVRPWQSIPFQALMNEPGAAGGALLSVPTQPTTDQARFDSTPIDPIPIISRKSAQSADQAGPEELQP